MGGLRQFFCIVAFGAAAGMCVGADSDVRVGWCTGEYAHSSLKVSLAAKNVVEDFRLRVIWESADGDSMAFVPLEDTKWWTSSYSGEPTATNMNMWSNEGKNLFSTPSVARPEPKVEINGVDAPEPQGDFQTESLVMAVMMTISDIGAHMASVQFSGVMREHDPITGLWVEEGWQLSTRKSGLMGARRLEILEAIHEELGDSNPTVADEDSEVFGDD